MKSLITVILVFLQIVVIGQNNNFDYENSAIKLQVKVKEREALLRWAPTDPIAWKQLNQYGYTIERYTVSRDGKALDQPIAQTLNNTPIVPAPAEKWKLIMNTNDNAAIVAQAIYGEQFEAIDPNSIETIVALSEELVQRHTFALYTADQDFEVALLAGLAFIDKKVSPNEKYAYRVISNVPEHLNTIDYGRDFSGFDDYVGLPKPLDLNVTFSDATALLSWNYKTHTSIFSSYNIERAEKGKPFIKLNKTPFTLLNQNDKKQSPRIYYTDSIVNSRNYQYRVQGVSIFGEKSPYSEIISGEGLKELSFTPFLNKKELIDDKNVTLHWEFPEEGNVDISSFQLNTAYGDGKTKEVVLKDIPKTDRSVLYNNLEPSNYFTISAVSNSGKMRTSSAMLVQTVDSIPPVAPVSLSGKVDSIGVVTLQWKKNTEKDILGYHIFRGNIKNEEYSQITHTPVLKNIFIDTVTIKSLNSEVFYKVAAVDQRFNQGELSEIIELKKPDIIPPTSPIIKSYSIDKENVSMVWVKSSSKDAAKIELYRKQGTEENWVLIYTGANDGKSNFIDKSTVAGGLYSYTLISIDNSGLESQPSPAISVKIPGIINKESKIRNFYGAIDKSDGSATITWNFKGENLLHFEIYKAQQGEKLTLLREVSGNNNYLKDTNLKINTSYTYAIRAMYKNGQSTKFKKFTIKY